MAEALSTKRIGMLASVYLAIAKRRRSDTAVGGAHALRAEPIGAVELNVLRARQGVRIARAISASHTPDLAGPISFELMAQDTITFIDTVVGGPVHLLGVSDGAIVALEVTRTRPDLVRQLVFVAGVFITMTGRLTSPSGKFHVADLGILATLDSAAAQAKSRSASLPIGRMSPTSHSRRAHMLDPSTAFGWRQPAAHTSRVSMPRMGGWRSRATAHPRATSARAIWRNCHFRTISTFVTGFNSMQYAGNPVVALREARRVANIDAPVAVVTWGNPENMEAAAVVAALRPFMPPPPPGAPGPFALSAEAALRQFAAAAGLKPIEIFEVDSHLSIPTKRPPCEGLNSSGVSARAIQNANEQAVSEAQAVAIAPFRNADGSYRIGALFLCLLARRS